MFTLSIRPRLVALGVLSLSLGWAPIQPPIHSQPIRNNLLGSQSQNEGLFVLPAPATVTLDGDLEEWDLSGRIWSFADVDLKDQYSVQTAAMWDEEFLYLAFQWRDPTPMVSAIDPRYLAQKGWRSDALQLRIHTDRTLWLTSWWFTEGQQPTVHLAYWQEEKGRRVGVDQVFLTADPGEISVGQGVESAYRQDPEGQGYGHELKLPWSVLYERVPPLQAGDRFQLGLEFLWGDQTGQDPAHRYVDNVQPGETLRQFFWESVPSWGDATLLDHGEIALRTYGEPEDPSSDPSDQAGDLNANEIPITVSIPSQAEGFTVVIDSPTGTRVRNLVSDGDPRDYPGQTSDGNKQIQLSWDGRTDHGDLVPAGSYRVRGLTHGGLDARYRMSYYNPGTPPWPTASGQGGWGADHSAPSQVARAGDWMILGWPSAEGGSGVIGLDPQGQRRWGEKRGALVLAADPEFVYVISGRSGQEQLLRLGREDGSYQPFQREGETLPFNLGVRTILDLQEPDPVQGMAVHGDRLALSLASGRLVVLDARSATVISQFEISDLGGLAFAPQGQLYGVIGTQVARIDLESGEWQGLDLPDLEQPGPITVHGSGDHSRDPSNDPSSDPQTDVILVGDLGSDSQIKAYSSQGERLYTVGQGGGRPLQGPYQPEGLHNLHSIAVDHQDRIWVVEHWDLPRRVSVWSETGALIREYIGSTGYSGAGAYLHDQDPELAYIGPMEFRLDLQAGTATLERILVMDQPPFWINPSGYAHPQRFRSDASGQMREYLFQPAGRRNLPYVLYMERQGRWQPVSLIGHVGHLKPRFPEALAGLIALDGLFWNDLNGDGQLQRQEVETIPAQPGQPGLTTGNGWGGRMGQDLTFYSEGLYQATPLRFTPEGAPVYGPQGWRRFGPEERGDLVPVPEEDRVLALSFKGYAGPTTGMLGLDETTGEILWSYPNPHPGVHGSHRAPMELPNALLGPLKILGVAEVNPEVGRVFALRSNLGYDTFMTTDGLWIGTLFEDSRLPVKPLPETEAELLGESVDAYTLGSEPFNGWLGRQSDGQIRMVASISREAGMILDVEGLETVQRFQGPPLEVDEAQLIGLRGTKQTPSEANVDPNAPQQYTLQRIEQPLTLDGSGVDWKDLPHRGQIGRGDRVQAGFRAVYTDTDLYLFFRVQDPTPWRNEGKDLTRLFKTGDAVDLQLRTDPGVDPTAQPIAGDIRLVLAPLNDRPQAVLMYPVDPNASPEQQITYSSPVGDKIFGRVEVLSQAEIEVTLKQDEYVVEARIPLPTLGFDPQDHRQLDTIGDFGVHFSDQAGTTTISRSFWSSQQTINLVSDLPLEAWLYPQTWGQIVIE